MASISSVVVRGLYGSVDISIDFEPGVNILYGANGSGKTTILHIIANILNGEFDRFAFLDFDTIDVLLGKEEVGISISRLEGRGGEADTILVDLKSATNQMFEFSTSSIHKSSRERDGGLADPELLMIREQVGKSYAGTDVTYFPAFRAVMEAFDLRGSTARDYEGFSTGRYERSIHGRRREERNILSTREGRRLFGEFVPRLNYPSIDDIEIGLSARIRNSALRFSTQSQDILNDAFLGAFRAAVSSHQSPGANDLPGQIVEDIRRLAEKLDGDSVVSVEDGGSATRVYEQIRETVESIEGHVDENSVSIVLAVYRDALQRIDHTGASIFDSLDSFLESLNLFLENKKVVILRKDVSRYRRLVVVEGVNGKQISLSRLSSGERQLTSMLYASTLDEVGSVVLIDEPELSLHIDWQRTLLSRMSESLSNRQIIVATHSPDIGADFEDRYQEVRPVPTIAASVEDTDGDGEFTDEAAYLELEFEQ